MKTLPALASISALAAFALLPHTLPIIASLVFGACLVGIFAADYSRTIKPLTMPAKVVEFPRPARRAASFGLAA
jgi:hypothetical protein